MTKSNSATIFQAEPSRIDMSEKIIIHNKKSTEWKRRALKKRQTPEEKIMWEVLRNRNFMGIKFRRQQGFGEFIVDFYASEYKLVVEIDGNQHYTKSGLEYDKMRTTFIENFGAKVLRFKNREVREDLEAVKVKLRECIEGQKEKNNHEKTNIITNNTNHKHTRRNKTNNA